MLGRDLKSGIENQRRSDTEEASFRSIVRSRLFRVFDLVLTITMLGLAFSDFIPHLQHISAPVTEGFVGIFLPIIQLSTAARISPKPPSAVRDSWYRADRFIASLRGIKQQ
jgi:hypothetical protein